MTTTFANPASAPPSTPLVEAEPGLLTGTGSMTLTLTAGPAPASVVVYQWLEDVAPGAEPGPGADPPGVGVSSTPTRRAGWFEIASGTLTVGGGGLAFDVAAQDFSTPARGASSYPGRTVMVAPGGGAIPWGHAGGAVTFTAFVALLGAIAGDYEFSVA